MVLVLGLKLVLNMIINLNKAYFSKKNSIWRYFTSESSKKNAQIEVFGHFLDSSDIVSDLLESNKSNSSVIETGPSGLCTKGVSELL